MNTLSRNVIRSYRDKRTSAFGDGRRVKACDSVRINDQWRVCFEWPKGSKGPLNVEIVDYH